MSTATVEAQVATEIREAPPFTPGEGEFPYLFTNEQFFRMVEADIFPKGSRVYLWDGRILYKMAKKIATDGVSLMFGQTLWKIVPAGWIVATEISLVVGQGKIPLPDFMILRGTPRDFLRRRPTTPDVGLVVELSHTSLKHDLGRKMANSARAGIPNYWVANLIGGVLVEHRGPLPDEGRYASVRTYKSGEAISLILDDVEVGPIAVDDLLEVP